MKKLCLFLLLVSSLSFFSCASTNEEKVEENISDFNDAFGIFSVTSKMPLLTNDKGIPLDVITEASRIVIEEKGMEYFIIQNEDVSSGNAPDLDALDSLLSELSNNVSGDVTIVTGSLPLDEYSIMPIDKETIAKQNKTVYKARDFYNK